jgi:hypothetical protein
MTERGNDWRNAMDGESNPQPAPEKKRGNVAPNTLGRNRAKRKGLTDDGRRRQVEVPGVGGTPSPAVETEVSSPVADGEPTTDARDIMSCRRDAPCRPPDWRWQRAIYNWPKGRPPKCLRDDQHIAGARRFEKTLSRCGNNADRSRLAEKHPQMHEAYRLYAATNQDMRCEIEARILAGEPFSEIDDKAALPAGTAECFESCFFNVADRLEYRGYIHSVVLGSPLHETSDCGSLWKLYGYQFGPRVVDQLVYGFLGQSRPETPEQIAAWWNADLHSTMNVQAALAARMMGFETLADAKRIFRLYAQLQAQQRANDKKGPAEPLIPDNYEENINTFVKSLPWTQDENGELKIKPGMAFPQELDDLAESDEPENRFVWRLVK